jgi:hypothetical protein
MPRSRVVAGCVAALACALALAPAAGAAPGDLDTGFATDITEVKGSVLAVFASPGAPYVLTKADAVGGLEAAGRAPRQSGERQLGGRGRGQAIASCRSESCAPARDARRGDRAGARRRSPAEPDLPSYVRGTDRELNKTGC